LETENPLGSVEELIEEERLLPLTCEKNADEDPLVTEEDRRLEL
jgi:hypothetical protein